MFMCSKVLKNVGRSFGPTKPKYVCLTLLCFSSLWGLIYLKPNERYGGENMLRSFPHAWPIKIKRYTL